MVLFRPVMGLIYLYLYLRGFAAVCWSERKPVALKGVSRVAIFQEQHSKPINQWQIWRQTAKLYNSDTSEQRFYLTGHITCLSVLWNSQGYAVAQLVEALHYKSEGRWFDFRWCHWNPSDRCMTLGLAQPPREMSTRNLSWGYTWPIRRADTLTAFLCRLSWNLGASTSWNPLGLSKPVIRLFTFTSTFLYNS